MASISETLLTQHRVRGGVAFWRKHRELLEDVRRKYGVPEEIMLAILGVETGYGKNTGKLRVIDSLATLAFHYPRRKKFFQKELREFFLFCRENRHSPFKFKGSYAGAMGLAQFIPSSIRAYAVSATPGPVNLMEVDDAVHSIANYLVKANWKMVERSPWEFRKVFMIRSAYTGSKSPFDFRLKDCNRLASSMISTVVKS